jgi:hypothetical protein
MLTDVFAAVRRAANSRDLDSALTALEWFTVQGQEKKAARRSLTTWAAGTVPDYGDAEAWRAAPMQARQAYLAAALAHVLRSEFPTQ